MTPPTDVPRQMREILLAARDAAAKHGWFEPRVLFRRRVGRMVIFPQGLGSALDKAVREGYLIPLEEKRGRNRRYAFTPRGIEYVVAAAREARRDTSTHHSC